MQVQEPAVVVREGGSPAGAKTARASRGINLSLNMPKDENTEFEAKLDTIRGFARNKKCVKFFPWLKIKEKVVLLFRTFRGSEKKQKGGLVTIFLSL